MAAAATPTGQASVATAILQGLDGLAQRHGAQRTSEVPAFRQVAQPVTHAAFEPSNGPHPLSRTAWAASCRRSKGR